MMRYRKSLFGLAMIGFGVTAALVGGCPDGVDVGLIGDIIAGDAPTIVNFWPASGYQGTLITIEGLNFSATRTENSVQIGGVNAIVVSASTIQLEAIVGLGAQTGVVKATVGGNTASAVNNFELRDWPAAGSGDDGPPYLFEGAGAGDAGDGLSSTGTINVLVIPAYPTDNVPPNLVNERQDIIDAWGNVTTFYDQASYAALDVQVDTASWVALTGVQSDYVQLAGAWWAPNLDPAELDRFRAECANGAVDGDGLDLDDYDAMACYVWVNGQFLRAWGGSRVSNFAYTGNGLDINITADHEIWQMALGETADWGRCAHELGHCLVSSPHSAFALGEDVYRSDLVDPSSATAASFDMMGSSDSHPLFSGYYLDQLEWFDGANIVELQWDRNTSSFEYDIAAHGTTEDNDAGQYHLVRIKVTDGLYYYIEVRQRPPGGSAQNFDTNIPVAGTANDGGVVVTKVLVDEVNNNQEMRFITLLHDANVMTVGDTVTDPARALEIEVLSEQVEAGGRLVCTVQIEWAQEMEPDPDADFDLRIEPWGAGYETVDIWIDRQPWGVFDSADGAGDPIGNGDRPRPMEINHFWARVHCDGGEDANNVSVAYYAITPPGVGDNGNWTPLPASPENFGTITADTNDSDYINWVPVLGEHTCLQVIVENQLGEITYGNNRAQENVFEFEAPASSVPDPIRIPLAVRNPSEEPRYIQVTLTGVPQGFMVQLPHRWVYLDGLGEKEMEAIVIPLWDIEETRQMKYELDLVLSGWIPWSYEDKVDGVFPPSKLMPIGGFLAQVRPKHRVTIELEEDQERKTSTTVGVTGMIDPAYADQPVFVALEDPDGHTRVEQTTTDAGGAFSAEFDLTIPPDDEPDTTSQTDQTPKAGDYKAVAYTVSAPDVVSTESNEVVITVD